MLRLSSHKLWIVMLAVPGASFALGLGDIHVQSALHEPLTAEIELVGATQEDLARLNAGIANEDTFRRYGLERAPFLFTTTLKVSQDKQGHPVLLLRSADAFTEPVVTFLIDVNSPTGELIREYTLLLDPPGLTLGHGSVEYTSTDEASELGSATGSVPVGFGSDSTTAASAPQPASVAESMPASAGAMRTASATTTAAPTTWAASAAASDTNWAGPTRASLSSDQTYTVARHDTLDHIVSITGARTRSDRHRMMIAIFRANPAAFQNNLNRLHSGVTLHIPSAAQLAAISADDANREFDEQMAARHAPNHGAVPTYTQPAPQIAEPTLASSANPAADTRRHVGSEEAKQAALTQRVESLEKTLEEMRQELRQPLAAKTATTAVDPASSTAAAPAAAMAPTSQRATDRSSAPIDDASATDASAERAPPTTHTALAANSSVAISSPATAAGATAASTSESDSAPRADSEDEAAPPPRRGSSQGMKWRLPLAAGLGLALAAGAWFYRRRRNAKDFDAEPEVDQDWSASRDAKQPGPAASGKSDWFKGAASAASSDPAPIVSTATAQPATATATTRPTEVESTLKLAMARLHETDPTVKFETVDIDATASLETEPTARLPTTPARYTEQTVKLETARASLDADTLELLEANVEMAGDTLEQKFSFFNPEGTTNTEHVVMGSALNEPRAFVERRKNPADVLRQAIEREPDRGDLRLKLLELYYTAAAQNRQAFLEVTRQLAKNQKLATPQEWAQIADMGRTIAPEDKLFAEKLDKQEVA
jgi:FimV-like protein